MVKIINHESWANSWYFELLLIWSFPLLFHTPMYDNRLFTMFITFLFFENFGTTSLKKFYVHINCLNVNCKYFFISCTFTHKKISFVNLTKVKHRFLRQLNKDNAFLHIHLTWNSSWVFPEMPSQIFYGLTWLILPVYIMCAKFCTLQTAFFFVKTDRNDVLPFRCKFPDTRQRGANG